MSDPQDPQQLQREIEKTREELGDTVEALAAKTDVKAQAKQRIEATKATVTARKEQLLSKARQASPESATTVATQASQRARENPLPLAVTGAIVLGLLVGRATRR